jgi:hypothetical protein
MTGNSLLTTTARGSAIFTLIGAGATLSLVEFMVSTEGTPAGALVGIVALSAGWLLLAAAVAGGAVGLQFRGDWVRAAAVGMGSGLTGFILQVTVLLGLLAALGGLLGLGPLGITTGEFMVLAALGLPAVFSSTVAALVSSELLTLGAPAPLPAPAPTAAPVAYAPPTQLPPMPPPSAAASHVPAPPMTPMRAAEMPPTAARSPAWTPPAAMPPAPQPQRAAPPPQ